MKANVCPTSGAPSSALRLLACALLLGVAVPVLVSGKPDKAKGKGASPDFVPPGHADKGVPPGHRRAPIEVIVKAPPPAVRIEVVPARPSPRHFWVAGFWSWEADGYVWVTGTWILPPEPAAVWVAPRFESRSGVSVFISGYWKL